MIAKIILSMIFGGIAALTSSKLARGEEQVLVSILSGFIGFVALFLVLSIPSSRSSTIVSGGKDLEISTRDAGDVTILDLHGKVTLGQATSLLRVAIERLLGEGKNKLLLNFYHVTSVDSSGLGEIKLSISKVEREGGALKGVNTSNIKDLMETTYLNSTLDCYYGESDALCSFN